MLQEQIEREQRALDHGEEVVEGSSDDEMEGVVEDSDDEVPRLFLNLFICSLLFTLIMHIFSLSNSN